MEERLPHEVDELLNGFTTEELEQVIARRNGKVAVQSMFFFHAELAPEGKIITSDQVEALEAEGWVDTPAKFNIKKEDSPDAEDEQVHERAGEHGSETQGPDADTEGSELHDQGEEGVGEDAGQGSGVLEVGEGLSDDEIEEQARLERKGNIRAAFSALVEEGDHDKFDKNGQPMIGPLNDLLGYTEDDPDRVKTIERNRAWEVYRENLKKEAKKAD